MLKLRLQLQLKPRLPLPNKPSTPMPADDVVPDDVVVVGRVGSPYGVQGWLHLNSYTSPPANILDYQPWLLKTKGGTWRWLANRQCRKHKKGFIAHFEDITDRDAAARLSGSSLGVPAEVLPELGGLDEFYWRDLVGCEVRDVLGNLLGQVDHLLETGANDVLVVAADDGAQCLIPFVAEYVQAIDMPRKTITVDWDSQW